ncbi:MAG: hypothetical protein LBT25_04845 [Candidatus Symbiothrix sp.]|jgi:hypothetical protein|nr:hypothetical protein [Candidatus Symbiothrix sp.]
MNKLIISFIASIVFSYSLKAQCVDTQMYDIYTPMGSPVTTWATCESSIQIRQGFDSQYAQNYPNAQQIITYDNLSSTRKFNCHGYVWLRVEQGVDRWIGYYVTTEEDIYMSDGSYTLVSQGTYPGKVSWGSGDHSAITTNQQGIFISKWNEWPLMRHAWNYSPFGSSNLKYYVRTLPTISGPDIVGSCASTFTLNNLPNGLSASWTVSSSLSIVSSTANSVSVMKQSTADTDLSAWVSASFSSQGSPFAVQKPVIAWRLGIQSSSVSEALMQYGIGTHGGEFALYFPSGQAATALGSGFYWTTNAEWEALQQGYFFTIFEGNPFGGHYT